MSKPMVQTILLSVEEFLEGVDELYQRRHESGALYEMGDQMTVTLGGTIIEDSDFGVDVGGEFAGLKLGFDYGKESNSNTEIRVTLNLERTTDV